MRRITATLLITSLAFFASAQNSLLVNSFGGTNEETNRQCVWTPFEQETGIRINSVVAYSADALAQLRAQRNSPQFDVIFFSGGQEVIAAEEGLLAPIAEDALSNYPDLYPFAAERITQGAGPVVHFTAVGLLYNTELVSEPPTSWNDLLRPEFQDAVILTDISNSYGLLSVLMLNQVAGGTTDDIGPGLETVGELLDHGAFIISTSPEILQGFTQSGALVATYAQDYGFVLQEAGVPVAFVQPEEGFPASFITGSVVANRPNTEASLQLVDFYLRPEVQACFAEAMLYSPSNSKTELSAEVAEQVVYGEEAVSRLVSFDPTVIAENRSAWTDAWNRQIAQ